MNPAGPLGVVNLGGAVAAVGEALGRVASPDAVDLNRATREELLTVSGIGTGTADRILAEREQRPFSDVEDFRRRVGPISASWERMRDRVTVR